MNLWCDGLVDRSVTKSDGRKRVRGNDVDSETEH